MPIRKGPSKAPRTPVSKAAENELKGLMSGPDKGRNADKMLNAKPKINKGDFPRR